MYACVRAQYKAPHNLFEFLPSAVARGELRSVRGRGGGGGNVRLIVCATVGQSFIGSGVENQRTKVHPIRSVSVDSVRSFQRSGGRSNGRVSLFAEVSLPFVEVSFSPIIKVSYFIGYGMLICFDFSREKEIQLWDHFVNALQNGVVTMGCNAEENDNVPPRLPCIVTNFLAQMSLIISEPLHPLFVSLSNFLLAKPSFDINTVPNFLALFYSTDAKYR